MCSGERSMCKRRISRPTLKTVTLHIVLLYGRTTSTAVLKVAGGSEVKSDSGQFQQSGVMQLSVQCLCS